MSDAAEKSTDLYEVLGVHRDASTLAIRQAYREKSKILHPDVPGTGSQEAFNQLRLARDVLTNQKWRENYDAIGDIPRDQADNAMAELITCLTGQFGRVMQAVLNEGKDPSQGDFIFAMQLSIKKGFQECNQNIGRLESSLAVLKPLAGRFRVKSFEQPNHMETIVAGQITQLENQISQWHSQLKILETTRIYLNDVAFFTGKLA